MNIVERCRFVQPPTRHGVELVISDDHVGVRKARFSLSSHAKWQRCHVHFLRNAPDYLQRGADTTCNYWTSSTRIERSSHAEVR